MYPFLIITSCCGRSFFVKKKIEIFLKNIIYLKGNVGIRSKNLISFNYWYLLKLEYIKFQYLI